MQSAQITRIRDNSSIQYTGPSARSMEKCHKGLAECFLRRARIAKGLAVLSKVKNTAIRVTHPARKYLADMVVGTLDTVNKGSLLGCKAGFSLAAEATDKVHMKHDGIPAGLIKVSGAYVGQSVVGLGALLFALPRGAFLATKNLLSGQTLKIAAKGSVEEARHVGWKRIIDDVNAAQEEFEKFAETLEDQIAQRPHNSRREIYNLF